MAHRMDKDLFCTGCLAYMPSQSTPCRHTHKLQHMAIEEETRACTRWRREVDTRAALGTTPLSIEEWVDQCLR